ncbi:MAG: amidohydrolase family protein [Dehalococcoidia bacterium]
MQKQQQFDIAINNGIVVDPLTRFYGRANVGISKGAIKKITDSADKLVGQKQIDAAGLVVAPGFINIHGHDCGAGVGAEFHVRDGITTEITGNCGKSGTFFEIAGIKDRPHYPIRDFFTTVEGEGLIINIASFIGHNTIREAAGVKDPNQPATPAQLKEMLNLVKQELASGGAGISFGPFYAPGATFEEMTAVAAHAEKLGGGASMHVRHAGPSPKDIEAVEEAIRISCESSIPLTISHRGGSIVTRRNTGVALELIVTARHSGVKVTTDQTPFTAGTAIIGGEFFNQPLEPLAQMMGVEVWELECPTTVVVDGKTIIKANERFSSFEQFYTVRDRVRDGTIAEPTLLFHLHKPEFIWLYYSAPFTMVENDDAIYMDVNSGKYGGHPRGAGAFAYFLGHWVREMGVCDLITGVSKCSTHAAVWLGLKKKGRVQVGCDADLTIFDPKTIMNGSSYLEPGVPSRGIPYVIVGGVVAVDQSKLTGSRSGTVLRRNWKVTGELPDIARTPELNAGALQSAG